MKQTVLEYIRELLKERLNRWIMLMGLIGLVNLLILCFTPYSIHKWVEHYRIWMMWSEIGVMIVIIGLVLQKVSKLNQQVRVLMTREGKETMEADEVYNFYDEKGDLRLSAKPEMIYYLEAADNYVQIHYNGSGKLQTLMMRNTLKNIEWRFKDTDLVRCHRSYIVNFSKVKMLRRLEGEVVLDFGDEKLPCIPVSKLYGDTIMSKFTKESK